MASPIMIHRSGSMQSRTPVYRRPSWAKTDHSLKIHMRKGLAANRTPGLDYGSDNFSYDGGHLSDWQISKALSDRLPPGLRQAVSSWQYAGAAVCTALDRIAKMDDESIYRGYPEHNLSHLSHVGSKQSPAVVTQPPAVAGVDTPPYGSPLSTGQSVLPASLLYEKIERLPQRQIVGMESPPFTPVDSQACSTPENGFGAPAWKPDIFQVNRRLTTDGRIDSVTGAGAAKSKFKPDIGGSFSSVMSTVSSTPSGAEFNEPAWETFLNFYKAELFDIRTNAWPRFKGCGHVVDRARYEASMDPVNAKVLEEFVLWWTRMRVKMGEYKSKVQELEEPKIELIRLERQAQGLIV